MKRIAFALLLLVASTTYAITPEQCQFFEIDDKTAICHATGSEKNPYVSLRVSEEACFAHAEHHADFVSIGDPTCEGLGCLPAGAPCDDTLGCCDGLACTNGVCEPVSVCALPGEACVADSDCCEGSCPLAVCESP